MNYNMQIAFIVTDKFFITYLIMRWDSFRQRTLPTHGCRVSFINK